MGGHFLGTHAGFPPLDIIAGFFSLIVASYFSVKRLKRLDASNSIEIVDVLVDPWNPAYTGAVEETIHTLFQPASRSTAELLQRLGQPDISVDPPSVETPCIQCFELCFGSFLGPSSPQSI